MDHAFCACPAPCRVWRRRRRQLHTGASTVRWHPRTNARPYPLTIAITVAIACTHSVSIPDTVSDAFPFSHTYTYTYTYAHHRRI